MPIPKHQTPMDPQETFFRELSRAEVKAKAKGKAKAAKDEKKAKLAVLPFWLGLRLGFTVWRIAFRVWGLGFSA